MGGLKLVKAATEALVVEQIAAAIAYRSWPVHQILAEFRRCDIEVEDLSTISTMCFKDEVGSNKTATAGYQQTPLTHLTPFSGVGASPSRPPQLCTFR